MSNWISIMQGLQAVKQAREDFLLRDFVEEQIIGPFLLDRVAEDISRFDPAKMRIRLQLGGGVADDSEQ